MTRRFVFCLAILLLPALFTTACQTTSPAANSPSRAEVRTAGWQTPEGEATPLKPAPDRRRQQEMEELRAANRELREKMDDLVTEVDGLRDPESGAAGTGDAVAEVGVSEVEVTDPVGAGAGAPTGEVTPETVGRSFREMGIADLEISRNAAGEVVVTIPGGLCFGPGKAELMAPARTRLLKLVSMLSRDLPTARLRVEAHTDSDPIRRSHWRDNTELSNARAKAAASFLVTGGGWAHTRVEARGFGESRPIASNSTSAGKARNRRLEVVIVD